MARRIRRAEGQPTELDADQARRWLLVAALYAMPAVDPAGRLPSMRQQVLDILRRAESGAIKLAAAVDEVRLMLIVAGRTHVVNAADRRTLNTTAAQHALDEADALVRGSRKSL
jgi:hypothetical protein